MNWKILSVESTSFFKIFILVLQKTHTKKGKVFFVKTNTIYIPTKNARILMNTTNALLLLVVVVVVVVVVVSFLYYACQCVLVTLLPSALSMISPRWVMTINALMTAHSLTPTRDKSSTR